MKITDEMKSWKGKPKELVAFLARSIEKDERLLPQLMEILETGPDVEKGTCADIMKHVSKDRPEILVGYIDELVEYIDYKAPRVKWGVQESVGNIAQRFPKEAEKAIPRLLANTKDKSTVVRWCAAFALSEIVKNNSKMRNELLPKIERIVESEKNNGVKNVYLKALKTMGK